MAVITSDYLLMHSSTAVGFSRPLEQKADHSQYLGWAINSINLISVFLLAARTSKSNEISSPLRRSAKTFAGILDLLRGYPLHIRDAEYRQELIRDCRYFSLNGLEQQLIPHEISFNISRCKSELAIRLENVRPSGVSFVPSANSPKTGYDGWINYARPHVDEKSFELLVEIGDESMKIDRPKMSAELFGTTKARIASLLQVIDGKNESVDSSGQACSGRKHHFQSWLLLDDVRQ